MKYANKLRNLLVFTGDDFPKEIKQFNMKRDDGFSYYNYHRQKDVAIYSIKTELLWVYFEVVLMGNKGKIKNATIQGFIQDKGKIKMVSAFNVEIESAFILQTMGIINNKVIAYCDTKDDGVGHKVGVKKDGLYVYLKWKDDEDKGAINYLNDLDNFVSLLENYKLEDFNIKEVNKNIKSFLKENRVDLIDGFIQHGKFKMGKELFNKLLKNGNYKKIFPFIEIQDKKAKEKNTFSAIDLMEKNKKIKNNFDSKHQFYNFLVVYNGLKTLIMKKNIEGEKKKALSEKENLEVYKQAFYHIKPEGMNKIKEILYDHKGEFKTSLENVQNGLINMLKTFHDLTRKMKERNQNFGDYWDKQFSYEKKVLQNLTEILENNTETIFQNKQIYNSIYLNDIVAINERHKKTIWGLAKKEYLQKKLYKKEYWESILEYYRYKVVADIAKNMIYDIRFRDELIYYSL